MQQLALQSGGAGVRDAGSSGLTARRLQRCSRYLRRHASPGPPGLGLCRHPWENARLSEFCVGELLLTGSSRRREASVCASVGEGEVWGFPRGWYPGGSLGVPKRVATNMSISMEAKMPWEPDQSEVLIFLLSPSSLCFSTTSSVLSENPPPGELRLPGEREDGRLLVSFHRAYT